MYQYTVDDLCLYSCVFPVNPLPVVLGDPCICFRTDLDRVSITTLFNLNLKETDLLISQT